MKKLLVTGSSGLIGSEVCQYFAHQGWSIHGIDNNQRAVFFGPQGDTRWNQKRLESQIKSFVHHEIDIRDRAAILDIIYSLKPDAIVHTAAQPSHDLAASIPFDDFETNAVGTLNLLEATRQFAPPNHSGVELHGFLSYLVKCNLEGRTYQIFGYKGKQVRDNIHSFDVARLIDEFIKSPRCGEVYNLGGGKDNTCSILEAFDIVSSLTNKKMIFVYRDEYRQGDHKCYYSNLDKIKNHYPNWSITKDLEFIFSEIVAAWSDKLTLNHHHEICKSTNRTHS